jgi:hypothetical protein
LTRPASSRFNQSAIVPIPEPSTVALAGVGAGVLWGVLWFVTRARGRKSAARLAKSFQ